MCYINSTKSSEKAVNLPTEVKKKNKKNKIVNSNKKKIKKSTKSTEKQDFNKTDGHLEIPKIIGKITPVSIDKAISENDEWIPIKSKKKSLRNRKKRKSNRKGDDSYCEKECVTLEANEAATATQTATTAITQEEKSEIHIEISQEPNISNDPDIKLQQIGTNEVKMEFEECNEDEKDEIREVTPLQHMPSNTGSANSSDDFELLDYVRHSEPEAEDNDDDEDGACLCVPDNDISDDGEEEDKGDGLDVDMSEITSKTSCATRKKYKKKQKLISQQILEAAALNLMATEEKEKANMDEVNKESHPSNTSEWSNVVKRNIGKKHRPRKEY